MSDVPETPAEGAQPTVEQAAVAPEAPASAATAAAPPPPLPQPLTEERPELVVGGAFAGGLVLALLLKRLAR